VLGAWGTMKSISIGQLIDSAASERFAHLSVFSNPKALWSGLALWHRSMAGPALSILTLVGVAAGIWGRKTRELIPLAGWLFLSIALFTFLPKRNDFYLVTAIPATYLIITVGLAGIPRPKVRAVAFILSFWILGHSWFGWIDSEEKGEKVQEMMPLFENIPAPYFFSPMRHQIYDVAKLGRILTAECGARGVPVIFTKGTPLDGWEAFYTWHYNSNILVGDIKAGRIPKNDNVCLVGLFELHNRKPYTIEQLLDRFEETATVEARRNLKARRRLNEIREKADQYRLIHIYNMWGIFIGPGIKK